MGNKIEDWIIDWCKIYPEDAEFNGRKLAANPKDVLNKMSKFCKEHPSFNKEIIFAATRNYVREQYSRDFKYTKQASYFISKLGEPSLLEQGCERVLKSIAIPEQQQIIVDLMDDFI